LAHHKSAIKRIRTSNKARERNIVQRSALRTALRKVRTAPSKDVAQEELTRTIPIIDKAVHKGIVHRNAAARYKHRLTRFVNAMPT